MQILNPMIALNNIGVMFGGFTLLDSISFQIDGRERIGLTGRNGAGKTTLLRIIAGEISPTSGSVATDKGCKIGYLPQMVVFDDTTTVREEAAKAYDYIAERQRELETMQAELAEREDYETAGYMRLIERINELSEHLKIHGAEQMEGEIEVVLKGLGFEQSDLDRPCAEFSGGWRMRVELAKLLLQRPDIFLLDEPTNHLDIESVMWLESFLQRYPGAVLVVSHDRAFLDNLTTRTIEISMGKSYDYRVPYSQFEKLREERVEQQMRAYSNQQKQIKDTEEFIERFRYKATKAVQVQSRIKLLDKMERIEVEDVDRRRIVVRFQPAVRPGDVTISAREAGKSYGENEVLRGVNMTILRGEKVAFVGKNGAGKTTLVKMIMGEIPFEGEVKRGHNVKVGYFAQNQADLLDTKLTVFDTVEAVAVGDIRRKLRDILGAFLFSGEDIDKKVAVLSGGERTRLAMVRLLLEPYNVLILDEPTNHLDIRTKDVLKEALRNFEGTVVCVSHDRDFLTGLAEKVYEFADGGVKEYLGDISEFLAAKKISCFREYEELLSSKGKRSSKGSGESGERGERKDNGERGVKGENRENRERSGGKSSGEGSNGSVGKNGGRSEAEGSKAYADGGNVRGSGDKNREGYDERRRLNRELRKAQQDVASVEREIGEVERELSDMESRLNDGSAVDEEFYRRYGEMKRHLERLMKDWEQASLYLEQCRAKTL